MLLKRLFGIDRKSSKDEQPESSINEGIYYLYLIIGAQIAFVFGLTGVIVFMGKVLSTPGWVFIFALMLGVGGCVYIYRKAKEQFRKFRENLQHVNLSNRNYEISFMGGVVTMRVEQNNQPLLQAPSPSDSTTILDAETVEAIDTIGSSATR